MPYAIITEQDAGKPELRDQTRPAHIAYLEANAGRLLAAGAKLTDDGKTTTGGIMILDTDDRAEAERFIAEDPFTTSGVFSQVQVVRWRKAFFDFKKTS